MAARRTTPRPDSRDTADHGPLRFAVRVQPGARRPHIGGRYGDAEPPVLQVRVTAPAVDGRANQALTAALAEAFGVPARDVRIVSGVTHRTKLVEVSGADPDRLRALLNSTD